MTDNEIKQTLKDIFILSNSMDKEHLEKLFLILSGEKEVGLWYTPIFRKTIRRKLTSCMNKKHLNALFNHKQIKQMYTIMGDYEHYPVCALCGKPIRINSETMQDPSYRKSSQEFTWDHIYPKSLGGANDLSNMQPTHKSCNNSKGAIVPEDLTHYQINVVVNICFKDSLQKIVRPKNRNIKKAESSLHKQDAYRKKTSYCRCRE